MKQLKYKKNKPDALHFERKKLPVRRWMSGSLRSLYLVRLRFDKNINPYRRLSALFSPILSVQQVQGHSSQQQQQELQEAFPSGGSCLDVTGACRGGRTSLTKLRLQCLNTHQDEF